jgi:hypothetical protein
LRASVGLGADIAARYDISVEREHAGGHSEVPGATDTDHGPSWDRYLSPVRAVR